MSDGVAVIRARLKLPDTETFIRTFAPRINVGGMLVRTKQLKPLGSRVRFEFSLENGERMLLGEGIVRKVRSGDQPGMTIRFTKLNRASKELVDRIVAFRREQQGEVSDSLESFSDMDLSDAPDLPPTAAHDHPPIPGQLPAPPAPSARLGAASPALSAPHAGSPALPSPSAALQALRAAQQAPKAPVAASRPFVEPPKLAGSPLARAATPQASPPPRQDLGDPLGGAPPFHTDSHPSVGAVLQSSRVLTTLRDSGQIPAASPEPIPLTDALDRLEHEEDGAAVFDPRQSHAFAGLDLDEAEVDDVLGNLFGSADSHAPLFFMCTPPAHEEEPAWGAHRLARGDELVPTPAVPEAALPLAQMAGLATPSEEIPSAAYDSHFDRARAMASIDERPTRRATPDQPWDPFAALSARRVQRDPEPTDEALDDPFASPPLDSFDRLLENPSAFGEGPSVFGEAPSVYPELQGAAVGDNHEPDPQASDPQAYEPQAELDLGAPEPAFHSGANPLASDAFEDADSDGDPFEGAPFIGGAPQAAAPASEEPYEEEPPPFFGDHAAQALHRREEAAAPARAHEEAPARAYEEFEVDLEDFDLPPLAEQPKAEPARELEPGASASQGLQALGRIKLARRSSASLPAVEEPESNEPTEMLSLEDLAALKSEASALADAPKKELPAPSPQDEDSDDDFFEAEVFKAPSPREESPPKAELPRFSNLVQPPDQDEDDLSVDVPLDDEPLAALHKPPAPKPAPKPAPEIELFAPPSFDEDNDDDDAPALPLTPASITPLTDFKTLASRGPTLSAMPKIEIRGNQDEAAAIRPSAALKPIEPARPSSELFGLLDELLGRPSAQLPSVPFAAAPAEPSKRLTLASQSIPELPPPPKEAIEEPDDPSLEELLGAARRQIQQHQQEEAPPEEVRPPDAILDDVIGEVAPLPRASSVFQAVAPASLPNADEAASQAPKKKGFFSRLFGRD